MSGHALMWAAWSGGNFRQTSAKTPDLKGPYFNETKLATEDKISVALLAEVFSGSAEIAEISLRGISLDFSPAIGKRPSFMA